MKIMIAALLVVVAVLLNISMFTANFLGLSVNTLWWLIPIATVYVLSLVLAARWLLLPYFRRVNGVVVLLAIGLMTGGFLMFRYLPTVLLIGMMPTIYVGIAMIYLGALTVTLKLTIICNQVRSKHSSKNI